MEHLEKEMEKEPLHMEELTGMGHNIGTLQKDLLVKSE